MLDTITDHAGRTITLSYDTAGRIETLEDPAGNETVFGYDTTDRLTTVTYPDETPLDATDNPERTYHYENTSYPGHLTGITDENGDRYATFGYNSSGEPSFTEHAGGVDRYDVDYLSGSLVEITNPLGKTSEWTLAVKQGERKVTAVDGNATTLCAASTRSISYDAEGYRNEVTDERGHITDYDHNDRGLVTSKTEAKGTADERSTTTSWHADFRVPTQIVEPGRTITFTYDSSG